MAGPFGPIIFRRRTCLSQFNQFSIFFSLLPENLTHRSTHSLFINTMEDEKQVDMSSTKAVLLGALAPGVNGPTWNALKFAFLLLGLCLAVMLGLAFSVSDSSLILHVGFLVLITATLFLLLSWLLSQTGMVSVEQQMQELNLMPNDHKSK